MNSTSASVPHAVEVVTRLAGCETTLLGADGTTLACAGDLEFANIISTIRTVEVNNRLGNDTI
jgi:hypothetical protein